MLLAALSLGLMPLIPAPMPLLLIALGLGFAQALISPSTLALCVKHMHVRHTGTGAGIIGALKNVGKVAGPMLGGLMIHWHNFSWMLWSMASLLAVWSIGLLCSTINEKSLNHNRDHREYEVAISVNP